MKIIYWILNLLHIKKKIKYNSIGTQTGRLSYIETINSTKLKAYILEKHRYNNLKRIIKGV